MDAILIFNCQTWTDWKNTISAELYHDRPFVRGSFWFRGHSNAEYGLESSFDRWFSEIDSSEGRADTAKRLIRRFEKEAELFAELQEIRREPDNLQRDARVTALAQHSGLPTRLLDWSESPYVAAFFAFTGVAIGSRQDKSVAIWALDAGHRVFKDDSGIELITCEGIGNARMHNQRGCFTILRSPKRTIEEHLMQVDSKQFKVPALRKFVVPDGCAREALADLEAMNITHASLFPGLDGCTRAARVGVGLELAGI